MRVVIEYDENEGGLVEIAYEWVPEKDGFTAAWTIRAEDGHEHVHTLADPNVKRDPPPLMQNPQQVLWEVASELQSTCCREDAGGA